MRLALRRACSPWDPVERASGRRAQCLSLLAPCGSGRSWSSGSVPELVRAPSLILEDEAGYGLGEALELERADGIELEYAVERRHGLAVGEDLAGLRLGTEARGEVGDVADGGIVPAALE